MTHTEDSDDRPIVSLRDVVRASIDHAAKLFELSGALAHSGEKGVWREFFVGEVLRPLLPPHFGVSSGVVG